MQASKSSRCSVSRALIEGHEESRGREEEAAAATEDEEAAPDKLVSLKKMVLEEAEWGAGLSV